MSARICAILESNGFFMAPVTLQNIHEKLFHGLMEEPYYERNFRDYNFSKREFILCRESVEYGESSRLQNDLDTAFAEFAPPAYSVEDNSLRFRNALVRASYSNDALGVAADPTYINRFIECLLANEAAYPFRNRDMAVPELFAAKGMLPPAAESTRLG